MPYMTYRLINVTITQFDIWHNLLFSANYSTKVVLSVFDIILSSDDFSAFLNSLSSQCWRLLIKLLISFPTSRRTFGIIRDNFLACNKNFNFHAYKINPTFSYFYTHDFQYQRYNDSHNIKIC